MPDSPINTQLHSAVIVRSSPAANHLQQNGETNRHNSSLTGKSVKHPIGIGTQRKAKEAAEGKIKGKTLKVTAQTQLQCEACRSLVLWTAL